MNYNFNDVMAELRSGIDPVDIAKAFAAQLNEAINVMDTSAQFDEACNDMETAWTKAMDAYIAQHGLPDGVNDKEMLYMGAEDFNELITTIWDGSKMLSNFTNKLKSILEDSLQDYSTTSKYKPTPDGDDFAATIRQLLGS